MYYWFFSLILPPSFPPSLYILQTYNALCPFAASCILQLWRYLANFKPCKCPICSCLIINLVPESSVLIQPGEEVGKILKNIQRYNRLSIGGWSGLFMVCSICMNNVSWVLRCFHWVSLVLFTEKVITSCYIFPKYAAMTTACMSLNI